jgi:ACR3 family arsenite transporter
VSIFERYLTLWVAMCIVVGIAAGHFLPGAFQALASLEYAKVNLPMGCSSG